MIKFPSAYYIDSYPDEDGKFQRSSIPYESLSYAQNMQKFRNKHACYLTIQPINHGICKFAYHTEQAPYHGILILITTVFFNTLAIK